MIEKLIAKWEEKHTKLLNDYNSFKGLSENEALFLRSEMRQVVEMIEDLKAICVTPKATVGEVDEKMKHALGVAMVAIEAVMPTFVAVDDEKQMKVYTAYHTLKPLL